MSSILSNPNNEDRESLDRCVNPYTILYVMGVGHSGSTLFNLLLNSHSRAVGLSELHFLKRFLDLPVHDALNPLRVKMWRDVVDLWEARIGVAIDDVRIATPSRRSRYSWSGDQFETYRQHNRAIFDSIAEVSGASVLVDSSKSFQRLRMLIECDLPIKVVHLVRDGRGVINSYHRKYGTFMFGFRRWFLRSLLGPWTRRALPELDCRLLRYEDLAAAPEASLQGVCSFVGLEYEPSMLHYWEAEDVSIGGNRMRGPKRPICLDEKWRREMSAFDRAAFMLAGGWLNRIYGYPLMGKYEPPVNTAAARRS